MPAICVCDGWRDCGKAQLKINNNNNKGTFPTKMGAQTEIHGDDQSHTSGVAVFLHGSRGTRVCIFPLTCVYKCASGRECALIKA